MGGDNPDTPSGKMSLRLLIAMSAGQPRSDASSGSLRCVCESVTDADNLLIAAIFYENEVP